MKYIGSDFQVQPINTQTQDAKLLDVPNIANDSFNSIRQSVAESQRINSTAANADAEAVGRKVVAQQPASGGIIGGITEIAKVGLGYIEAQKKAEAAAAEKEFILEANKLAANAPDLINKTDQGGIGYQAQVEALARRYSGTVDATQLQTQLLRLYSPVQQSQEQSVTALRKEADKIKDSQTEVFVKTQVLNLDTQLADLQLIPDVRERQTKIDNITRVFTDSLVNSKLSSSEKLYATNAFLTVLGKSSAQGSEVGAKLMSTLREINDTNAFIEQNRGVPPEQLASLNMARLAILSPAVRAAYEPVLDLAKVHQREVDAYKQNQEFQQAARRNELQADKAFQLQSGMADALTARYLNSSGVERAQLDKQFEGVPALEAISNAGKQYLADQNKKQELAKESAQLAGIIAGIGKGDAKERLGWVQQAFNPQNVSLNIGVNNELQQAANAVQALQRAMQGGVPKEIQAAQQDVEKYNKVVLEATQARAKQVDQLLRDTSSPWTKVEELMRDPQKRQVLESAYTNTLQNLQTSRAAASQSILQGTNPNFNMPQLAELQVGDVKLPLPFKSGTQVTFTSDRTPDRDGRPHAGIDIAVAENTPLIAPIGGVIASVMSDAGYGNFIDVRTPDGKILRYAHLNAMHVKEGQQILPGQVIGLTGNTGTSTGAHLHFEVRNDLYGGYENTEDPIAWSVKNLNNANRGLTARRGRNTPNGIPPNAVPLSGAYIQNNQIVRDDGTVGTPSYTARNPIKNMPLPADKNAYSSSPDKNYGYQTLAQDKEFRMELNRVSRNLKIPTQWLADLMAFETGGTFSTSIENTGNYGGARGLIQFMPETAADLGTSSEALARMSRTQQMKYVEKYLMQHTDNGKLISKPEDLVMAVWGGIGNLQKLKRDPESVRNLSDGDIKFHQYVKRLGEHAGRFYETSYEPKVTPVHTQYRSSCTMCQALIRSGSGLIPHQKP
jgi:murein DD-endopeptidase MepM/ murein hydrolase activator NlpD